MAFSRGAPPPGIAATVGQQARDASAPAPSSRSLRGTVKGRLSQLFDIKKVPHKPAVAVQRWDEEATLGICERWAEGQRRKPSAVSLSRLAALNFERARPDAIPADMSSQRLLPVGSSEDDYNREMIVTLIKAVSPYDVDAVIDSFKKAGTGGLHRKSVTASSTMGGALSVAQLAASSHPPAKTALSAIQVLMTGLTTQLAFDSADLRVGTAGTEEVMPLGKADAPPSAKTGPNVLQASSRVVWDLRKIGHAVAKMERAQQALDEAHIRVDDPLATPAQRKQAERDAAAAAQALSIAYARFCLRNELKTDYKTAAESAKIEYHGNKHYIANSVASGALSVSTTLLGVLTPVLVSATVTAGVTGAAVALAALLYVAYQLSPLPSKDGEAKAKRAIVALAKSIDLFAGNAAAQQKARAAAYRAYIAEKRLTPDLELRKQAKARLLAQLEKIARDDTTKKDVDPQQNWRDYTGYRRNVEAAAGDEAAVHAIESAFTDEIEGRFNSAMVGEAWKTPERMRFDSMGRILSGTISESIASLHAHNAEAARMASRDSKRDARARLQVHAGARANVKAALRDWIYFEVARSRMKAALGEAEPARAREQMTAAAHALSQVANRSARDLFSGDASKQVDATEMAKRMTIGERERYTVTNGGPAALGGVANMLGATAGLGLNVEKAVALSHGVQTPAQFGDQNDARVLAQSTAPVTAPYTAAERTRFQKTGMAKLVKTIARKGERVKTTLALPTNDGKPFDLLDRGCDAALEKLVDELEATRDIPDEIAVSLGGEKLPPGKFDGTTAYYKWRYEKAPFSAKAKFLSRRMGMLAGSIGVSVASPVAQGIAQIPLKTTRADIDRGNAMSARVRERLTRAAAPPPQDTAPEVETPAAQEETPFATPVGTPPETPFATPDETPPASPPRAPSGETVDRDGAAPATPTLTAPTPTAARPPITAPGSDVETRSPAYPGFDAQAAARAANAIPILGGQTPVPVKSGDNAHAGRLRETRTWLTTHGIAAARNSGNAMNCLIIALLQHATGRYGPEAERDHAAQAARFREMLARKHPGINEGDRMLYADEAPAVDLMRMLNEAYGLSMDLHEVRPGPAGPVRLPSLGTGKDPVAVLLSNSHFEALHPAPHASAAARQTIDKRRAARSATESGKRSEWPLPARLPALLTRRFSKRKS